MLQPRVRAVRAVEIGVTDLAGAVRFFSKVWHLDVAAEQGGVTYLSATGPFNWIVSLRQTPQARLERILLDAASPEVLDQLRERLPATGGRDLQPVRALDTPGGGRGFGLKDPEGRNLAIVTGVADRADRGEVADRPIKIAHVNLNCVDAEGMFAFFRDGLGFRLSERTRPNWFLRCNSDHCSIVISRKEKATLNHIAFDMPGIDDVMRGIGRMRDNGFALGWGPGRHGPGNAVFSYFIGPERLPIEYTTGGLKVDDETHVPKPIEHWGWPPGRLDHWGLMPGPTPEFKATQELFSFSADGHKL